MAETFEYKDGASFGTVTTAVEGATIDLHRCHQIFADIHGDILKTFRGCPVRVVTELEGNEWFIGISEEMFRKLEDTENE